MGFTAGDDCLPKRMFEPVLGVGPLKGHMIDKEEFEKALALYYQMMGWDREGKPSFAKTG